MKKLAQLQEVQEALLQLLQELADEANEMADPNLTKRTIEEGTGPL